jgi:hypothetical protein
VFRNQSKAKPGRGVREVTSYDGLRRMDYLSCIPGR